MNEALTICGEQADPQLANVLHTFGWNNASVQTPGLFLLGLRRLGYRPSDTVRRIYDECSGIVLRDKNGTYLRLGATRLSNFRWASVLLFGSISSFYPPARLTWPISESLLGERCTPVGNGGVGFPIFMTDSGKVLSFDIDYGLLYIYPTLVAYLHSRFVKWAHEREIFWNEDGYEGGVLDPDVNIALFRRLESFYQA